MFELDLHPCDDQLLKKTKLRIDFMGNDVEINKPRHDNTMSVRQENSLGIYPVCSVNACAQ